MHMVSAYQKVVVTRHGLEIKQLLYAEDTIIIKGTDA